MLYASRVGVHHKGTAKHAWFKACVLFLAISNLSQWAVDSFILNKNEQAILILPNTSLKLGLRLFILPCLFHFSSDLIVFCYWCKPT